MTARTASAIALCLLLAASACSSDTTPSSSLTLAGNWSGSSSHVDATGKTVSTTVAATLFQNASNVTGNVTLTVGNGVTIPGAVSGVLAGSSLALTTTFATGAYLGLGSATCSSTSTFTGTATATTISGTLFETFAAPCVGTISAVSTLSEALNLTKQ